MSQYKTLQHKSKPGQFGIVIPCGAGVTLGTSSVPALQPLSADMPTMIERFNDHKEYYQGVLDEIENYDLVIVELLTILPNKNASNSGNPTEGV